MKTVIVTAYNTQWPNYFEQIKAELSLGLSGSIIKIDHVGSTSVPGLAAKPIIDIDIVIKDYNYFEAVKEKLSNMGYTHEGDLGIKDRQAFTYVDKSHLMKHHLYICPEYSKELKRHIAFRDYLRSHPKDRDWYGEVKVLTAECFPEDIDSYITAKSPCVLKILEKCKV